MNVRNRRNTLGLKESVEQYLASIDIGLLETPLPSARTVDDVLTLIAAKDDKEAIGIMYQALLLMEVYINRMIQYLLMLSYNASKRNADKPVSQFFDSDFNVITDIAQEYLRLILSQSKENKVSENKVIQNNKNSVQEFNAKYKEVQIENDTLKKQYKELSDKLEVLNKENERLVLERTRIGVKTNVKELGKEEQKVLEDLERREEISKREKRIEELSKQLLTEKETHEETKRTLQQYEIDLNSFKEIVESLKSNKQLYF